MILQSVDTVRENIPDADLGVLLPKSMSLCFYDHLIGITSTQRVYKKRGGPTIFVFLIFNGWLLHSLKTPYFFTVVYTE